MVTDVAGGMLREPADERDRLVVVGLIADIAVDNGDCDCQVDLLPAPHAHHLDIFANRRMGRDRGGRGQYLLNGEHNAFESARRRVADGKRRVVGDSATGWCVTSAQQARQILDGRRDES